MSRLPIFVLNNFYRPTKKEKESLIKQIEKPKNKFNDNDFGAHNVEFKNNKFNKKMYLKFLKVCKQILQPFTLHKNNNTKSFVYCINKFDYNHVWHNHSKTCTINSVYYLKVPKTKGNQLEMECNGTRFDFFPKENDFIIFPRYINHAPKKPESDEYRISINFELLCNEPAEKIFI